MPKDLKLRGSQIAVKKLLHAYYDIFKIMGNLENSFLCKNLAWYKFF